MKLNGKVAIVTGSGRGIGRAIALTLAKEGALVTVCDIDPKTANSTADEIKSLGGQAIAVKTDVTNSREINEMVRMTLDKFNRIDILVNNAGGSGRKSSLFQDSTEESSDKVMGLNLKSVLDCTRAVLKHMIEQKSGKIVSISSQTGKVGGWGLVDYSAAKAGIIGFTKALAREVGPHWINVNCVCPGRVETADAWAKGPFWEEMARRSRERQSLERWGKTEDIANVVLFLASDDSSYMTGQAISVDGGQ